MKWKLFSNLLSCSDSFENLCQEAQSLSEGGHGSGAELRASAQLQLQHQALLKAARERLRVCQLSLQEQQNFEEMLQSTWGWLSGVQERLTSLNSTNGNKETLEKRLALVQVRKQSQGTHMSIPRLFLFVILLLQGTFFVVVEIPHTTNFFSFYIFQLNSNSFIIVL